MLKSDSVYQKDCDNILYRGTNPPSLITFVPPPLSGRSLKTPLTKGVAPHSSGDGGFPRIYFNVSKHFSMFSKNVILKLFFLIILFLYISLGNFIGCVGCPYSFTGASIPKHLKTLAIPPSDDRSGSGEPRIREMLTEELTQKFIDDNNFSIAPRASADAILECTIFNVAEVPMTVVAGEEVATYKLTVTVKVIYRDMIKKKVIFDKQFSNYGEYPAAESFTQREAAIEVAIDRITDDILLDTVSGW